MSDRPKPTLSNAKRASLAAVDRTRSLTQLEGDDWGAPTYGSHLVKSCHEARGVAIGALSIEQLRMLIGQRIGLRFLLPLALEAVERSPFDSGDYYPGDLLSALVHVRDEASEEMPEFHARLGAVLRSAERVVEQTEDEFEREQLQRLLSELTTNDTRRA